VQPNVEKEDMDKVNQDITLIFHFFYFFWCVYHPEHVKNIILVCPAGFSSENDRCSELLSTWKGVLANFIWESNVTPQAIIRYVEQFVSQ
jgi:hypothetical protein